MDTKRQHQGKRTVAVVAAAGLIALCALALPEVATAGDDFERGFKRELGAIAAQEVVGMGRHILLGVVTGYPAYTDRHVHRTDRWRRYRRSYRSDRYGYRPYRPRNFRRHQHRRHRPRAVHEHHHYYGDGCGH